MNKEQINDIKNEISIQLTTFYIAIKIFLKDRSEEVTYEQLVRESGDKELLQICEDFELFDDEGSEEA